MRPPPRSSPPFPYTTLFRSDQQREQQHADTVAQIESEYARPIVPDRKSTRLNSSHGYISYAVLCLKKKTCAVGGAGHPRRLTVVRVPRPARARGKQSGGRGGGLAAALLSVLGGPFFFFLMRRRPPRSTLFP